MKRFKFKPLTDKVKAKIFGLNSAKVYGIDVKAKMNAIPSDYVTKLKEKIPARAERVRRIRNTAGFGVRKINLYMKFASKKFKLFKLFFVFLIFGVNLTAQENPSVVIENSFQAIGGKKEFAKIQSIKALPIARDRTANTERRFFRQKIHV